MWWAGLLRELRSVLSDRTVPSPPWERSEANRQEAGDPGFWEPLEVQSCDKPQCPPHKEHQREGGELAMGRKQKGYFLTNIHSGHEPWELPPSLSLLPGIRGRILSQVNVKTQNFWKKRNPNWTAMKEILQAESKPRENCRSKSQTALRYNYIYIYICIFIYMLYTKKLRYQAPLNHTPPYKCNCSSTLGTVLGYTCRVIGKA